ncbi:MAG: sporulation protein YqfD [Lachnospiraceae bacterium]
MFAMFIHYIRGYLRIRMMGYSPEKFMNLCSHHKIYIWGLESYENSYEMYISIKGFRKLKPIIKKTGTKIIIIKRYGLPFFLHLHRKRKPFFCGIVTCVLLIYLLSLFIWDINIEGNLGRTDETILEFLKTKQMVTGILKTKVDCERIVKDIRKQYNDIIWVSASIKGTRILIRIKENESLKQGISHADKKTDLVANKDGIISEIITRKGVPLVKKGDRVKTGDILVTGRVEIKDDSQNVVGYQYVHADADIYAITQREYEDHLPYHYIEKQYYDIQLERNYIILGGYRFSVGTLHTNCNTKELHTKETQLQLNNQIKLPLSYGTEIIKPYRPINKQYTDKEVQQILTDKFLCFEKKIKERKLHIIEKNVKIYKGKENAMSKGYIVIKELIGESKETETLPTPKEKVNTLEGE